MGDGHTGVDTIVDHKGGVARDPRHKCRLARPRHTDNLHNVRSY
jgi:hypothetical protein